MVYLDTAVMCVQIVTYIMPCKSSSVIRHWGLDIVCASSVIYPISRLQGFTSVLDKMEGLTNELPLVKSHVASFAADAVINSIVTLNELAAPMEDGASYPLFLLCMQQVGSGCVTHVKAEKFCVIVMFTIGLPPYRFDKHITG